MANLKSGRRSKEYADRSDEWLVSEFQRTGERELFEELAVRHLREVLRMCYRYVRNQADAEDLVHDSLMSALENIHSFKGGSFGAWLRTIGKHCAINFLKKHQHLERQIQEPRPELGHLGEEQPQSLAVREVLSQLSSGMQRACLKLFYIHGHSREEIADMLGISVDAVKSHLQNGKRMFRQLWSSIAAASTRGE